MIHRLWRELFGRDYFISYTRRDAARYASRLAARLGETHSVYLDQLDTPRGSELPPALRRALRGASTTVLVGSPGALGSRWVHQELETFLPTGRPVMLIDVDQALDAASWNEAPWRDLAGVYRQPESRQALDAGQVSDDVLAYLRDSFSYTRQNLRLRRNSLLALATLVATGTIASFLVSNARTQVAIAGEQTRTAEAQRTRAEEQAESAALREKDAAGRAATAERDADQATVRAEEARKLEAAARNEAARQERISLSRRLAGESAIALGQQPDLGLLLAVHAWRADPTGEARRALFDASTRFPALRAVVPAVHDVFVWHTTATADGRLLATRDVSGGTVLWDVLRRRARAHIAAPSTAEGLGALDIGALAFSPDGSLLAVADNDHVQLWDVAASRVSGTIRESPSNLAFVGPRLLALSNRKHAIAVWDVTNPSAPAERPGSVPFDPDLHALSSDPQRGLWALRDDDGLMICRLDGCDAARDRIRDEELTINSSHSMVMSSGAAAPLVAAALREGLVGIWDAQTRRQLARLRPDLPAMPDNAQLEGLTFSARGDELAVARAGGVVVFDLADIRKGGDVPQRRILYGGLASSLAFAGHELAVAQTDGTVAFLDSSPGPAIARRHVLPSLPGGDGLSWRQRIAGGGQRMALAHESDLRVWRIGDAGPPRAFTGASTGELIEAVAVSDDGRFVASVERGSAPDEATLVLWDAEGRARYRETLRAPRIAGRDLQRERIVSGLAFGGTARHPILALSLMTNVLRFYDATDIARPRVIHVDPSGANEKIVFDQSGFRAAAIDTDSIRVWDLAAPRTKILKTDLDLKAIAFTADGATLIGYVAGDGTASLVRWNLHNEHSKPAQTVLFAPRDVFASVFQDAGIDLQEDPVFSRDGSLLAFSTDERIVVWDVAQGSVLGAVRLADEPSEIAFSSDSTQLFATNSRSVTVIEVGPDRLAAHACGVAGRPLTTAEVARFFTTAKKAPIACASPSGPSPGRR